MARASRAAFAGLLLMACAADPAGIDRSITVAGGELDVWCDGGDGPTIMFLAAIGGDDTLLPIAERFSGEANACFYFRPGDGETAAPPDARSAASDAADLHELIVTAELATPAILVAHSYGGLIAMTVAAEHHEDVAGVVFVDSSVPVADERFYPSMTDAQRAYYDHRLDPFVHIDWHLSVGQAAAALEAYPSRPATVITSTRAFLDPCDPELPCEALQATWIDVQTEFADLIGARQVFAETSHYVYVDDPDLVEREIRDLIERSGVTAEATPEPG